MKTADLLFYLNYKYKGEKEVGYMLVSLAAGVVVLGLVRMIQWLGYDFIGALNAIYPLDLSDSVRSPLNKKSGFVVLFVIPMALMLTFALLRAGRAAKVIAHYDARLAKPPSWVAPSYSILLVVPLYVCGLLPSRKFYFAVLPMQLLVILLFEFLVCRFVVGFLRVPDGADPELRSSPF